MSCTPVQLWLLVFAYTSVRTGLQALPPLSLWMVSLRRCLPDGMAASGAVLAVSFTVVHENPEECGEESRAHEMLKHLLLRVHAPVVVQRQADVFFFFRAVCTRHTVGGSCPQGHDSWN